MKAGASDSYSSPCSFLCVSMAFPATDCFLSALGPLQIHMPVLTQKTLSLPWLKSTHIKLLLLPGGMHNS